MDTGSLTKRHTGPLRSSIPSSRASSPLAVGNASSALVTYELEEAIEHRIRCRNFFISGTENLLAEATGGTSAQLTAPSLGL